MNSPAEGSEAEGDVRLILEEHCRVAAETTRTLPGAVAEAGACLIEAYRNGHKLLIFGNGGSFSDALHIEGELTNRFQIDRQGLPAICLGAGQATLTATANDYSYAQLFSRLVRALGCAGDVAMGLSTSGRSENVVAALRTARDLDLATIAMTGENGGPAGEQADILIAAPSSSTARVQEMHILVGHILCDLVEKALFPAGK